MIKHQKEVNVTQLRKLVLSILANVVILLMVVALFGGKNHQEEKKQEKEGYETSQFVEEEAEVEKQVPSRARSQVVITSEMQQLDPKVAERLQAAGFSTQFAKIHITSVTEKGEK